MKGNLLRLLAELFRSELSGLQGDEKVIADKANYELVAPVFPYIAEHYAQKITLKDLAAACCVNVSHLCRVFKKLTGKTVMEYLNEYRLSKAPDAACDHGSGAVRDCGPGRVYGYGIYDAAF